MEHSEKTVDDRLFSDAESRRDAWNRLRPFFKEVMASDKESVIIISHGDLLSMWNAMIIGLPVELYSQADIHGSSGGVSHTVIDDDGKRSLKHMNEMSYIL